MARDPSKTEQATPKRVKQARKKGNVPKSQEVSKTASVLAGLVALTFWIGYMAQELTGLFRHFLANAPQYSANEQLIGELALMLGASIAKTVLPIMLIVALTVFVSLRWQVGRLWTTKVFAFKLSKLNPINGIKRMFISMQTLVRLLKSLLQAIAIGLAPILVLKEEVGHFADLYYLDATAITIYILSLGAKVTLYALVPMLIIAIADWKYTKWDYNENLKMTKDEVKDERKQQEGDPRVRQAVRSKMLRMSMSRMMEDVPKADVVITNPTHIAIALSYKPSQAPAPLIVAMGVDRVAEKIKEIAKENRVPIRENKALARALYKQTQVGDMIPAEMFQAVAIILAQIWKTKNPGRTIAP